jgi:hypothetical protein
MVDFLTTPSASQDPHQYTKFARNATGFVAESAPGSDAQLVGGQANGSAVIRIIFGSVTSITYQIMFFIEKAVAFVPGPTFTKTPTDQGEKIDLNGTPFGIKVTAMAGAGNANFYVSISDRATGGN